MNKYLNIYYWTRKLLVNNIFSKFFSQSFLNKLVFKANCKFLFYLFLNNVKKRQIYLQRVLGFANALLGKKSSYRPKIKN